MTNDAANIINGVGFYSSLGMAFVVLVCAVLLLVVYWRVKA